MLKAEYSCIKFSGLEWELPLFLVFQKKKWNAFAAETWPTTSAYGFTQAWPAKDANATRRRQRLPFEKINEAFSHNKRSPRAAKAELFPTAGDHTGKHNSNVGSRWTNSGSHGSALKSWMSNWPPITTIKSFKSVNKNWYCMCNKK